ncbi:diguanylate cyclase (GGDEF) domain-containing protein [Paenisporosarcina quisquiliarum]|nr:diguanylate cyclase (GGDEF) domain-containing protein [Paenisporosarcina quisquiliarum]
MDKQLENEITIQKKMVDDLSKYESGEVDNDELPKLPNSKHLTEYIKEVIGDGREDMQVALCIIDLDHFKRYNDFHGRIEGNRCLQQIANCIKTISSDRQRILLHADGDEFVCFLTDISAEEFVQMGETLRNAIEHLSLLFCWEQHSFQVTISVGGVHGLRGSFKDEAEMFSIAYEELYKAKSSGRNNVKIKFK